MSEQEVKNSIEFTVADDEHREPLIDIKPNFEMYVTSMEEGRALIHVDLALTERAPIPQMHWLLGIQLEFLDPDVDGFYTEDEEAMISEIQQHVIEVMESEGRCRFVGSVTYAGTRMFYFYGEDENYLAPLVGKIAAEYRDYDFNFMSDNDGNWNFYFNALYPSEIDTAHIRNRHMVQNLLESGIDIHKDYSVYYYFYFQDGASRVRAASELEMMGFETIDSHAYIEALEPMSLGLKMMTRHNLELMTLTEKTYDCFELMEKYIGIFDGWELAPAQDTDSWI